MGSQSRESLNKSLAINKMSRVVKNESTPQNEPSNTPTLLRLYRLIRVMTSPQKRDFRKNSRFAGETRAGETRAGDQEKNVKSKTLPYYIQLFDAINRFILDMKEVNLLQKHLERNHLGNRATLSERADYLYTCILESLRSTPDRGEMLNRLNSLMQDINTLYHKGLRSDCQILIEEANKIAREIDKPAYLLELLWWQALLQPAETERSKVIAVTDAATREQSQIIQHGVRTTELRNVMHVLTAESRQVDASLSGVPEHWRPFFEMNIKEALQFIPGTRAKAFFLSAFRPYCEVSSKIHPEERQYWLEKMVEAYEILLAAYQDELLVLAKEDPANSYWTVLENHITLCRRLEKQVRADELMEIYEKEADKYLLIYHYLNKYIANTDAAGAIRYIEKEHLLPNFERFKEILRESRLITICYQCGFVYFIEKRWSEAHEWFSKPMEGHRPDAHNVAMTIIGLLDIICSFEMETYGKSKTRLFENFEGRQKRADQWNTFIKSITDILKNHLSAHNDQDIAERLKPLQHDVSQNKLLGMYGVVLAWIEARLNGTTYLTELKKYN